MEELDIFVDQLFDLLFILLIIFYFILFNLIYQFYKKILQNKNWIMQLNPEDHIQYKIVTALDESMVLDCFYHIDDSVNLYKWHTGPNQRWKIIKQDKNNFKLINSINAKTLHTPKIGTKEWQLTCKISKKTQDQIWRLEPCQFHQVKYKNAYVFVDKSGRVMDVTGGSHKNGDKIAAYPRKKGNFKDMMNQIWFIQPASFIAQKGGEYRICSALDYKLTFDACKATDSQAQIVLYPCHGGDNQRFFVCTFNGKYILINKEHNFSLRVDGGSSQNQAKIVIGKIRYQKQQLWDLIPCPLKQYKDKDAYYLRSHCGKYLDVSNGQAVNYASLIQWHYNGDKNQIWFVHKF